MTTDPKKPMTVADITDAIFGDGSAEKIFTPDELVVARRAPEPPPPIKFGRHIRLKVTPSGVYPTHPAAPLGLHDGIRTVQINSIPQEVSTSDVVRLYASTVDMSDSPMWEYEVLKPGRILR